MVDDVVEKLIDAHRLEENLMEAVFDYVDEDATKTTFGLNAAIRASVALIKGSTMSNETRLALAQCLFMDLTSDLPLGEIMAKNQSH